MDRVQRLSARQIGVAGKSKKGPPASGAPAAATPAAASPRSSGADDAKVLRDHIVDRTCRLADAMVRMSSWHMKARWNLRHTDLRLLNVLDGEEALSVNEISRRTLVDQAWVSRSLKALAAKKLIGRRSDPNDSRLTLVSLTKRGRATLDEFRPWAGWSEKVLLQGIDEQKLKALLDGLEANTESLMTRLEKLPRKVPKAPPQEK